MRLTSVGFQIGGMRNGTCPVVRVGVRRPVGVGDRITDGMESRSTHNLGRKPANFVRFEAHLLTI
jgi:hypothetical protein